MLDNWVLDKFTLAGELFAKELRRFESCLSVHYNLCGKIVSRLESTIIFKESFTVNSVASFVGDLLMLLVFLNLLQSTYNFLSNKYNQVHNQLYNHLLFLILWQGFM